MRRRRVHLVLAATVAVAVGGAVPVGAELAPVLSLECAPCGMEFDSRAEKARHEISGHGAEGCLKCGVVFDEVNDSDSHAIREHGARECLACNEKFRDRDGACDHLVSEHGHVRCGACDRVLGGEAERGEHAKQCAPSKDPAR